MAAMAESAFIVWKVQRRSAAGGAPTTVKDPNFITINATDCLSDILTREAPQVLEQLVQVKMASDDSFRNCQMVIHMDGQFAEVGLPVKASRMYSHFLFIVAAAPPAEAIEPAPRALASFFRGAEARRALQVLSLPEPRRGKKCSDLTFNHIIRRWEQKELGFNAADGVGSA